MFKTVKTILLNWHIASAPVPNRLSKKTILLAWLGAFLATLSVAGLQHGLQIPLILGSFGASCLLVFAYPSSPFAQPRNVIGGHFIASFTGLLVMQMFGVNPLSMAFGVASAIALMLLFNVPHPPAGSNPVIVMLALAKWNFLWTPTLLGSIIIVLVALIYNNLFFDGSGKGRRYPLYW